MMVVKVEIWPGGDATRPYEIGRMEVANESNLAEVSDYSARIVQLATERLGVPAIDAEVTVAQHPRSDGPWALVKRVLDQLQEAGRRRV